LSPEAGVGTVLVVDELDLVEDVDVDFFVVDVGFVEVWEVVGGTYTGVLEVVGATQ